jgi:D-beta-D-heptose 7-phosphate kinase/D-beta-D-heptose 1-phosphate adenosyltransferase
VTLPPLAAGRARQILSRFSSVHVLVVGDLMVDRFIVGTVTRISPEAPVPVVRYAREHIRLGGAANVAHNLVALGARVSLIGVVGADRSAEHLRQTLQNAGVPDAGLIEDASRPTTEKVRIVTDRNQQVARIDYEQDAEVSGEVEQAIAARIREQAGDAGAVLVSDYLKGVVTAEVMAVLLGALKRGVPLIVDPKIPHLTLYAGASLVTPNHHEAETATHRRIRDDEEARAAALDFRARARCEAALITRGEQGMWLSAPAAEGSIPAVAREVSDVTGAGDTVAATLTAALAAGATLAEAAFLANHAAGVVVRKFGAAVVTAEELNTEITRY